MIPTEENDKKRYRFGVVSDTHGLLRDELRQALQGVDGIIHAGDVGSPELLRQLRCLAPVTAVRGNMDAEAAFRELSWTETLKIGAVWVYVLHDLQGLDLDPVAGGFQVVISGHSHRPAREVRQGVMFLNPGSAGPRRFTLPVSMALLEVSGKRVNARIVTLNP